MKVGKIINDEMVLVEVEGGVEVNGDRTEEFLYRDGWKKACPLLETPTASTEWIECPTCFVEQIKITENYE